MKKLLLLLTAVFLLAGCQSQPVTGETVTTGNGSYTSISPSELSTILEDKNFIFINVHIPFAGNIPETDLSISFDQIEQTLSQVPVDKDTKIVAYCRNGRMSQMAAVKLVSLGYTNVWVLQGGMVDWEQSGYPIEK